MIEKQHFCTFRPKTAIWPTTGTSGSKKAHIWIHMGQILSKMVTNYDGQYMMVKKITIWLTLFTKGTLLHTFWPSNRYLALQRALWDPKDTYWDPNGSHSVQNGHKLC